MANVQYELTQVKHIDGDLHLNHAVKIGLVVGRFNSFVVESLVDGAVDTLIRHGVSGENISIVRVPGAWEIPLTVSRLAKTGHFDAIIALGAVIRGSTPHFDFVAGESAKGLGAISIQQDIPIINAILTTDSIEQAIERSGTKAGNKGSEASLTALEMISVLNEIEQVSIETNEQKQAESHRFIFGNHFSANQTTGMPKPNDDDDLPF